MWRAGCVPFLSFFRYAFSVQFSISCHFLGKSMYLLYSSFSLLSTLLMCLLMVLLTHMVLINVRYVPHNARLALYEKGAFLLYI